MVGSGLELMAAMGAAVNNGWHHYATPNGGHVRESTAVAGFFWKKHVQEPEAVIDYQHKLGLNNLTRANNFPSGFVNMIVDGGSYSRRCDSKVSRVGRLRLGSTMRSHRSVRGSRESLAEWPDNPATSL